MSPEARDALRSKAAHDSSRCNWLAEMIVSAKTANDWARISHEASAIIDQLNAIGWEARQERAAIVQGRA